MLNEKDQLVFTWNTDAGNKTTTIDLAKFIDDAEFNGENLILTNLTPVAEYNDPANNDSLNTAIAKLTFGVTKAMQDAADAAVAGVTSFGGQTGAITVDTVGEGEGNVKFTMADNKLKASVTGLKSAAYTESSAYATAAQGTKADSALQTLNNGTDGTYVTTTVGTKANNAQTIGVAVTIQAIKDASASSKGVLEAYDAKTYIDTQIASEATEPIPEGVINGLFTGQV